MKHGLTTERSEPAMTRAWGRRIAIAAFALVLGLCSVFVLRQNQSGSLRSHPSDKVALVFHGFITNSPGGVVASFRLRNDEPRAISYVVGAPQIQRGGEWPHRLASLRNPTQSVLRPHGQAEISFSIPTGSDPWRIPVAYTWAPSLYQRFSKWISVHVFLRFRGGTLVEHLQTCTIFSPTITR